MTDKHQRNYWPYIILMLFSFALYFNTISHDYALDDAIAVSENSFTKEGISGIKDILANDTFVGFFGSKKNLVSGGRYRPFSLITLAIEFEFFGLNPHFSHFINILLYAFTGLMLYWLLSRLLTRYNQKKWYLSVPFLASMLFIAHPVHTEVVANIKGRDEILTLMGALGAMLFVIKYQETRKSLYLLFSSISMFLGLMSKENAVTFLAIIPLTTYYFTKQPLKKNLLSTLPLLITFILFFLIRKAVLGNIGTDVPDELMNNPFLGASFAEKYATIFYTLGLYVKLLFFPHPLTYDYYPYHIPIMDWGNLLVILSFLFYIAIGIIAIKGLAKKTLVSYGIWFYLLSLSIVSNVFFPIGAFMNERFIFISSIGFCIIIAYYLPLLIEKIKVSSPVPVILFFVVIFGLMSMKTIDRNKVWKNDLTLFSHDVKISGNSAKSNCSAGGKLLEASANVEDETEKKAMQKQALQYLRKAVAIHPTYKDALLLLGNAYWEYNKQVDSTVICYLSILKRNPNYTLIYNNIELIFANKENIDFQIETYTKMYKINPKRFEVNYNLGNLYGRYKNNLDTAIYFLERAVRFDSKSLKAYKDLGVAYGMKGNYAKSLEMLQKGLQIDSEDADIYYNMGLTYQLTGDKEKANAFLMRAAQLRQQKNNKQDGQQN